MTLVRSLMKNVLIDAFFGDASCAISNENGIDVGMGGSSFTICLIMVSNLGGSSSSRTTIVNFEVR